MKAQEIFKKVKKLNELNKELGLDEIYAVSYEDDTEYGILFKNYKELKEYLKETYAKEVVKAVIESEYEINERTVVEADIWTYHCKHRIGFYVEKI